MANIIKALQELLKQPYWVIALILGVSLVLLPCITIDKNSYFLIHPPNTLWPVGIGIALFLLSALAFGLTLLPKQITAGGDISAGLDLTRVSESEGELWTLVSGCEIRVSFGRIEEHKLEQGIAVVLPCNEYFDDRCVGDTKSALGAYVNHVFEGQAIAFISLIKDECKKKFGPGVEQQKTDDERAESFGAGHCVLLTKPLGRSVPVALISTTTQRASQGLAARISYLFDGMRELVARLADGRINEAVMPILGAGHGRIDPPLAFVGLLLAIAEAARYGQGGQRLKRVTIVVFRPDVNKPAEVDDVVVRRALALVASH